MIDLYRGLGLGVPALMDIAPLIARVVVGGMFFLSGFYKLFTPAQAEKMQKTMVEAGVAAPPGTESGSWRPPGGDRTRKPAL